MNLATLDPKSHNPLALGDVREKLACLESACQTLLTNGGLPVPENPGRDTLVVPISQLPVKPGLSTREGQARLIHDLASIELQAMELGLRTLSEFPEAPMDFRERLAQITLEEGQHLRGCLLALDDLEFKWGHWPVHLGLWQCVSKSDSLLDRIVIVHRYLEGSGLDAGDTIRRRLKGVASQTSVKEAVERIALDELGHVQFGSHWYRKLAHRAGVDIETDFSARMGRLFHRIPRRLEKINYELRLKAGFTTNEIRTLTELQGLWGHSAKRIHDSAESAIGPRGVGQV